MEENLITAEDARSRLKALCEEAGGVGKLAEVIGLSISAVSQQLHGHKPIHGRVAEHMGLQIERETTVYYREAGQQ